MNPGLDGIPGGVITLSADLRILAANRTMGELVGRAPDELVGQFLDVLLTPPSRILFQTHVYPALKTDGRVEEVFLTIAGDGAAVTPVLFNAVRSSDDPEPTYDGLIVRILARSRWETDLLAATKALERERAASQRLAEELGAAAKDLSARYEEKRLEREFRDAFVGVVSHELRTPITTVFGMSHLLRQRFDSMERETVLQHLADIADESDRLRRLTEDLLVLSRAEGGRLFVAEDPIALWHVARTVVDSERGRWANHRFSVDAPSGLPLVLGEEIYLEQVIRNLVSNAAKYSPPGTTVRLVVRSEDGGVAVRVIDAGPGLVDQDPDRLFELFYRAPGAIAATAGAGIGLFICRELIQAMRGRVWAAAAPAPAPSGAEFGFWLPAAADTDED